MLKINQEKCKKCQICAKNCPIGAIAVEPGADGKKVVSITNMCVECNVCRRVCPFGAIDGAEKTEGMVQCHSCSIQCKVPVGSTGACKRYTNEGGRLVRNRALVVEGKPQIEIDPRIAKPVITAVGAGTNYPCIRPAPHIVCEKRDGVDVVTTVTEAPLSYSGVLVKLDTNTYIGEEGDTVYCEGKPVGLVHTEEYGSKMIYVGGANRLTAKDGGFATARTIVALANGEKVELTVKTADHETGGMTIGFATTAYDTHFNYLTSQKISFADFDAVIADLREKNAAFEDALEAVKTYYGLTTEADQPLSLTESDVQALKAAFELSMTAKDARKENAEDALLYGGYEPFSMAVSHIMNNKAGLSYTSYAHTGLQIPVYAQGVGAQTFSGLYDNTDIFNKTMDVMGLNE